jgi:V/A-type H+-transporting ATPase subunit I
MSLVRFYGRADSMNTVLPQCLASGCFHPEATPTATRAVGGFAPVTDENPYAAMLSQLKEASLAAGVNLDELTVDSGNAPTGNTPPTDGGNEEISDIDRFVTEFSDEIVKQATLKTELEKLRSESLDALTFIEHFGDFNENLDSLYKSPYFRIRFGRLPSENFEKLSYYADKLLLFFSLTEDKRFHWGFFLTTVADYAETVDIFRSLYFESVWMPTTVHGTPEEAKNSLKHIIEQTDKDLAEVAAQTTILVKDNETFFISVYSTLSRLNASFSLRKFVGVYGDMFHLEGFIPTAEEERFAARFERVSGLELTFRPHDSDQRLQAPTKLKNNVLWKPFEMFVDMYGLPGYDEMDPTPFLAVTYTLLFGLMFGDLGQGIAIALFGLVLWKRQGTPFGAICMRLGVSSAIFGLAYGSVFGLEHVLDPLYRAVGFAEKPIEIMSPLTINNLLLVAVGIGVVLIVSTILLNIWQGIKARDIERAVFSNNGVAGLVFYGGVLTAVLGEITGTVHLLVPAYIVPVLIVPILVIFLKESLGRVINKHGGIVPEGEGVGSWIMEGFFELFEIVLSFVTNTLSFLRVGGFVISHAGMMAVVMTLAEMMNGAGSVIVLIFGNAFVIALEGFIVGIQGLRLQFYELFSHYYQGQGKPFDPIQQ